MDSRRPFITLATDFGVRDPFAGIMKGVIAGINPDAVVIDLTHGIAPQNIREGAFILSVSVPHFPRGTVHVAVVDPGVGSDRRAIAIETDDYVLIGPDNGVLSWAIPDIERTLIVAITRAEYTRETVSDTFHGRDIFAPASAHVSSGVPMEDLGDVVIDPVVLPFPATRHSGHEIRGEVLYIDRFGNLMTNINLAGRRSVREVGIGSMTIPGISRSYGEGVGGEPIALVGGTDYLEIAVYLKSAEIELGAAVGDEVRVLL